MNVLMQIATSTTLMSDPSQLDPLLATDGWQTLMTFTREHAREFNLDFIWDMNVNI